MPFSAFSRLTLRRYQGARLEFEWADWRHSACASWWQWPQYCAVAKLLGVDELAGVGGHVRGQKRMVDTVAIGVVLGNLLVVGHARFGRVGRLRAGSYRER